MKDASTFDPVIALQRGLEVLRVLNQHGEAGVLQLHKEVGLHRTTVVRMLDTLVASGYAARSDDGKLFTPTAKCLQLSNGFDFDSRLMTIAGPLLAAHRRKVGWPSDLAIFDRDAMVMMSTNWNFSILPVNPKPGIRAELLQTSLGRAYFAYCEPQERARILKRLAKSQNPYDEVARDLEAMERLVRETRARGYAVADPAYQDTRFDSSVTGFAVPILQDGRATASINIVFLRNVMSLEQGVEALLDGLNALARSIGQALTAEMGGPETAAALARSAAT